MRAQVKTRWTLWTYKSNFRAFVVGPMAYGDVKNIFGNIMPSASSQKLKKPFDGNNILVSTPDLEIEDATALNRRFWKFLHQHFHEHHKLVPVVNQCNTLYLDTPKFDVLLAGGTSLRDRGGLYDQFSVKYLDTEFTEYAARLTRNGPGGRAFAAKVRREIEEEYTRRRGLAEYKLEHFPDRIQEVILERVGTRAKKMFFKPQFATFVPRSFFPVYLDPSAQLNFMLPASVTSTRRDNHVCIEVAMDRCIHKRPPQGMPIDQILETPLNQSGKFTTLGEDYLLECEYKGHFPKEGHKDMSGKNLKDREFASAYARFRMFLHDLSLPFKVEGEPDPIRPVASKAARGYEALLKRFPGLAPANVSEIWKLAP